MRGHDCLARYGGDEFILLLGQASEQGAKIFCEQLRDMIKIYKFTDTVSSHHQTISIGYVIVNPNDVVDASELIRAADNCLYMAKDLGRDRVFGRGDNESKAWIETTRAQRNLG